MQRTVTTRRRTARPGSAWMRGGLTVGLLAGVPVALLAIGAAAALGSSFLTPSCDDLISRGDRYGTAVVLGVGWKGPSTLDAASESRAAAAADLYRAGVVGKVHYTGSAGDQPFSVGGIMRRHGLAHDVPDTAISVEEEARSTLQNALFSLPHLADAGDLLLVAEGYHLWRGAASFAWAGRPVAGMCHSVPIRNGSAATGAETILREAAAWWFNIVRGGVWLLAERAGVQDRIPVRFLE